MTRSVILLSGGMDSATVLAIARAAGDECYALSFDYGQKHRAELGASSAIAAQLGATEHRVVHIDLGQLGGSALTDATIEVPAVGGREPKRLAKGILAEILEPRVEEIFSLLKKELFSNGLENSFPAGFVLTGGSVVMDGIAEIAESVFNVPVRVGEPNRIGGLKDIVKNPAYATGVGLVIFGSSATCKLDVRHTETQGVHTILNKMKQWFKDII